MFAALKEIMRAFVNKAKYLRGDDYLVRDKAFS
jgi:hypothetical protein